MGTSMGLLMLLFCFVNVKIAHSEDHKPEPNKLGSLHERLKNYFCKDHKPEPNKLGSLHERLKDYFCKDKLVVTCGSDYALKWNDEGYGSKKAGSIWAATVNKAGFYPVGDTVNESHSKPKRKGILVKDDGTGLVTPPLEFKEIWNDRGSGGKMDVTLYKMIPEPGYVCLGDTAVPSYSTRPDKNMYRCVKSYLVRKGRLQETWNDKGSGAKAKVSVWSVEADTSDILGIPPQTFIAIADYNKPTEQPYVLQKDMLKLEEY